MRGRARFIFSATLTALPASVISRRREASVHGRRAAPRAHPEPLLYIDIYALRQERALHYHPACRPSLRRRYLGAPCHMGPTGGPRLPSRPRGASHSARRWSAMFYLGPGEMNSITGPLRGLSMRVARAVERTRTLAGNASGTRASAAVRPDSGVSDNQGAIVSASRSPRTNANKRRLSDVLNQYHAKPAPSASRDSSNIY